MVFSQEQAEEIKKKLIIQIDQLPQENKEQIKQYVLGLDEQELEEFLKQNKIQISDNQIQSQKPKCVFCSIAQNQVSSYKLIENKKALAILEINPLSRGHSLIIPLEHSTIEKLPKQALNLAQKIAGKIKKKLKPEDVKIETTNVMGHSIINVIPMYADQKLEKKQADEKELRELQSKLETKKRALRKAKEKQPVEFQEISF